MGILNMFKRVGLVAEEAASYFATRRGSLPLQWPAGEVVGMIWRLPRDPEARASLFASKQSLVVNEGEVAIVLEGGRSEGVLDPGTYMFNKNLTSALDIIWIRTGRQPLRWGVGNITTLDGVNIGANGTISLSVSDGMRFNREIIQGNMEVPLMDLQKRILPGIQGVMRSQLARYPAIQLKQHRDLFMETLDAALSDNLGSMGLVLVEFEIAEISFPAEFDTAISRKTLISFTGEADILAAQSQAQIAGIAAQAHAQAQLVTGMAQVQLMANMQSMGIDPLKNKVLDALQTMAGNPGQGIVLGDERSKLFTHMLDGVFSGPNNTQFHQVPTQPPPSNALPTPDSPAQEEALLRAKIDKLTERLADGEINGDTYDRAIHALNERLSRLKATPA